MKKIHEDQLAEVKKTVAEREAEIEDKIYQFNKHKEAVYEKARVDVREEERRKFDKMKEKLERVKQQEIAMAKREYKETVASL